MKDYKKLDKFILHFHIEDEDNVTPTVSKHNDKPVVFIDSNDDLMLLLVADSMLLCHPNIIDKLSLVSVSDGYEMEEYFDIAEQPLIWEMIEDRILLSINEDSLSDVTGNKVTLEPWSEPVEIETIEFSKLRELNDNFLVFMGLLITPETYTLSINQINDWFTEQSVINGGTLLSMKKIVTNVLGSSGRTDWLMEFSEGTHISPMGRLSVGQDVKWVSDFVDNSAQDYR